MRLSGTGMSEQSKPSSEGRRCRDIRRDPPPVSPVIAAAGGSDVVPVGRIDYVARWAGYDTEECIEKGVDDGYIELYYSNLYGEREYDTYRLTAKGRWASTRHLNDAFKESAAAAKRAHEAREEMRRSGRDGFVRSY